MIIKINKKTDIMWPLVALYILQCYVINDEMFYVLCCCLLGIYILITKKITIPTIPGLVAYLGIIAFITCIGLIRFSTNLVVRDVFYETSNLVPIILGYYLYKKYGSTKSMWKTVCLMAVISSVMCIVLGIKINGIGTNFTLLKNIFGNQVIPLGMIFPIFLGKKFVLHENTFSKGWDYVVIILMSIQLILSMSRTAIIGTVAGLCVTLIAVNIKKKKSLKLIKRAVMLIASIVIIAIIALRFMPGNVSTILIDKFANTFVEIDASNAYNSVGQAESDWRGYENYSAKRQWSDNNIFNKFVGEGNGALVSLMYVPNAFKNIVTYQNGQAGIGVLHNTYYSLLVKGGILMVILFLYFFAANIRKGFVYIKRGDDKSLFMGVVLIVMCAEILISAYVVRSMFETTILFTPMLLIGWINAEVNSKLLDESRIEDKGDDISSNFNV